MNTTNIQDTDAFSSITVVKCAEKSTSRTRNHKDNNISTASVQKSNINKRVADNEVRLAPLDHAWLLRLGYVIYECVRMQGSQLLLVKQQQ